jgi:8-oxo-dGTP pyrophosphatase MutT (NUDIX family)
LIKNNAQVLVVGYNDKFSSTNPNKKFGATPLETLARETIEESGHHILPENATLVYKEEVPDNRNGKYGAIHTKYFYLVTEFTGTTFDFEGPNPIDGETSAPIWIPAELAIKVVFHKHLKALQNAFEYLCEDKKYAIALMNVM